MRDHNFVPAKLTSVTFEASGGFGLPKQYAGRQQIAILFHQKKVIQRFTLPPLNTGNAVAKHEYSLSDALAKELRNLFGRIRLYSWPQSEKYAPDEAHVWWNITLRGGGTRKMEGFGGLPKGGEEIEKLLNASIDFEYPLSLFLPTVMNEESAQRLSVEAQPFIYDWKLKLNRPLQDQANEWIEVFLKTPLAKKKEITDHSTEAEYMYNVWFCLLDIKHNYLAWTKGTAYQFGEERLPLLMKEIRLPKRKYFELAEMALQFLSSQQGLSKTMVDELITAMQSGYEASKEKDTPQEKSRSMPEYMADEKESQDWKKQKKMMNKVNKALKKMKKRKR